MHRLVSELKPVLYVTLAVEPEGDVGAAHSYQGDPGGLDVPVAVVKVGRSLLAKVRGEHVQHILGVLRLVCVDIRRAAIAVLSHDCLLSLRNQEDTPTYRIRLSRCVRWLLQGIGLRANHQVAAWL